MFKKILIALALASVLKFLAMFTCYKCGGDHWPSQCQTTDAEYAATHAGDDEYGSPQDRVDMENIYEKLSKLPPCRSCSGAGKKSCDDCSARGWKSIGRRVPGSPKIKYEWEECPTCQATGWSACQPCMGTGKQGARGVIGS